MLILFFIIATEATLLSVVATFRHGARSPVKKFSWDTGTWPEGYGELTSAGMRMHYINGAGFRHRYIETETLISPTFMTEEIYVKSTNLNRTLMSAESFLSGLFPQGPIIKTQALENLAVPPFNVEGLDQVKAKLGPKALPNRYQPIPIHDEIEAYENMLAGYRILACPRFAEIQQEVQGTATYERNVQQYEDGLQNQIYQVLGVNASFSEAGLFSDTLRAEQFHDFPWPAGVTQDMFEQMEKVLDYDYSYIFTDEGASLSSSEFFQAIFDQFDLIINGTGTVKLSLYSTHDVTLMGFLIFLGVWDGINPPYASTIIFELYQNGNEYTVQASYNNAAITIPGCALACPYSTFKSIIEPKMTPNVRQACQLKGTLDLFEVDPLSVIH